MKTLDQIPPTWSQKLPAAQRFELVLDGEAVLDKETGLVWERSPLEYDLVWTEAIYRCSTLTSGGRLGWHLPTIEQLASLVDQSALALLKLPVGHPFDTDCSTGGCVQPWPSSYWSSSTYALSATSAFFVTFADGRVGDSDKSERGSHAWCVRGGQSYDAY
jgi:hypothetical protein